MARGRFISESVAKDARLNSLSVEGQLVYLMTVPHLDRDGLIEGDPDVLWGIVCPKRRQFLDSMAMYIQEWAKAGLVLMYDTDNGPVLWFKGFAKNQQGMRYDREAPSKFPPPPSDMTPDKLPTNSDNTPYEIPYKGQVEVKDQKEVKAEAAEAAPPATAAIDPDVARVWEAWNANMPGTKSQVITDGVNALLEDYSAAEIVEAIAIACRRHKRSLSYIQGILERGVFTEKPPPSGGDYRPQGNGRVSPVDRSQMEAEKLRAMLIAQGKEHILHG